jgi:DNA polymerase elongation subunit (family B)
MIPPFHLKDAEGLPGAFVKKPDPGIYDWIVTGDLASLYPHLIMQYNISPETLVVKGNKKEQLINYNEDGNQIVSEKLLNREVMPNDGLTLAANGFHFRKDKKGFLPEIMEKIYNDRKIVKKSMLKDEQELEYVEEEMKRRGLM